jgi:hypothetical protein
MKSTAYQQTYLKSGFTPSGNGPRRWFHDWSEGMGIVIEIVNCREAFIIIGDNTWGILGKRWAIIPITVGVG